MARALLGEHRDHGGQPQGGRRADAQAVRLPLCRHLHPRPDERERSAADGAQQLQRKLSQLGPLGENYGVRLPLPGGHQRRRLSSCRAKPLPDQAYGPASIFYRDDRGNVARLNGIARYGALIGRDRSVTFAVDNPRAEPVCEGTFTNDGPSQRPLLAQSCFNGKFGGNGTYESQTGSPNDHIIARGQTGARPADRRW